MAKMLPVIRNLRYNYYMKSEAVKKADLIQREVELRVLKPFGFAKQGRTFNRKTEDGLTQVITFQIYKKYPTDPTLLDVQVGIRVPEIINTCFDKSDKHGVFFKDYDCSSTLRTSVNSFRKVGKNYRKDSGFDNKTYFLAKGDAQSDKEIDKLVNRHLPFWKRKKTNTQYEDSVEFIVDEVCEILQNSILPLLDSLNSREKILASGAKLTINPFAINTVELDKEIAKKLDIEI